MMSVKLPPWLESIANRLQKELNLYGNKVPNHVLINEYEPSCGIMPHTDGNLYFPTAAIISLESPIVMKIYQQILDQDTPTMTTTMEEEKANISDLSKSSSDEQSNNDNANAIQPSKATRKLLYSILLEPRSLLILQEEVYGKLLHGIEFTTKDELDDTIANYHLIDTKKYNKGNILERRRRVSLTVRLVEKIIKGFKI